MPNPPPSSLAALIERLTPEDGVHPTAIGSLDLLRASTSAEPAYTVQEPSLCVIVQGRKRVMLGDEAFVYDAERFLLVSIDLPVTGVVVDATPDSPYLALRLRLDLRTIAELVVSRGREAKPGTGRGLAVCTLEPTVLDSLERLVRLLDTPEHIPALAPLIEREIFYRLLVGPEGGRLREVSQAGGGVQRIARAVELLRRDYARPLRVDELARQVGMSPSGLHHHFKAVTAMSPVQFQKQLRLQEARRLMLGEDLDAASASFRVGYESPSQFSREYRRLFGAPPIRDVARYREETSVA